MGDSIEDDDLESGTSSDLDFEKDKSGRRRDARFDTLGDERSSDEESRTTTPPRFASSPLPARLA